MFGLFGPSKATSMSECKALGQSAAITPTYKDGEYTAMVISLEIGMGRMKKHMNHPEAIKALIFEVERRVLGGQFDDGAIELVQMARTHSGWKPNLAVKRVIAIGVQPVLSWDVRLGKESGDILNFKRHV